MIAGPTGLPAFQSTEETMTMYGLHPHTNLGNRDLSFEIDLGGCYYSDTSSSVIMDYKEKSYHINMTTF